MEQSERGRALVVSRSRSFQRVLVERGSQGHCKNGLLGPRVDRSISTSWLQAD